MSKVISDVSSQEWLQVKKYCETRLYQMRVENDDDYDAVETAHLRGMIEFAKEVLSLDKAEPKFDVPDESYLQ